MEYEGVREEGEKSVCGYLSDGGVPVSHQQLVEALVPEEAAREEGPRWYRCV